MLRRTSLTALAALAATTCAFAQTFPEIEPNSGKSEATAVSGIAAGGSITGTTTGTGVTLGDTSLTTTDYFRVQTGALPLGIYKHTLTLTTTTATVPSGTIRGLNQTAGGVIGTTDAIFQTSSTAGSPANANHWFGFGKQEEIYYRVQGTTATTAAYGATLSTATVTPVVVPGGFANGLITLTSIGQTTSDTEIYVYDSNLDPMVGYHNDDEGPGGGTLQSRVVRFFPPGTYYVAVSDYNTANNLSDANADEDTQTGNVMDFPNVLCSADRETAPVDYDITISDGVTTTPVTLVGNGEFDIAWATFTVLPGAPANDACASAISVTTSTVGSTQFATNDGSASCDSGGAASRDVWYSFTAGPFGGTIAPDTCGSASETTLAVFASCGGAELACNDDCGGAPCAGPSSCLSAVALSANQTVLIRVSDKGTGGGLFNLNVNYVGNLPPNDSCATPILISGPGVHPFDTTLATAGQTNGTCSSLPGKNLWYQYTPTVSGSMTVNTCGQITGGNSTDTEIWVYQATGCPAAPAIACNDDGCGVQSTVTISVTCGTNYMIEIANFSTTTTVNISGTFTVTETGTACASPSTPFCDGSSVGTSCLGCGNNGTAGHGCGNSSFAGGGLLVNGGISSVSADTMTLTASDVTGPGLFFQANGLAGSPITFGDGMLCAAVGITRMGVVFPAAGVATYPGGLTPAPIGTFGATSGATLHYQCWYRDAIAFCTAATFNLTNGLSVTWAP